VMVCPFISFSMHPRRVSSLNCNPWSTHLMQQIARLDKFTTSLTSQSADIVVRLWLFVCHRCNMLICFSFAVAATLTNCWTCNPACMSNPCTSILSTSSSAISTSIFHLAAPSPLFTINSKMKYESRWQMQDWPRCHRVISSSASDERRTYSHPY